MIKRGISLWRRLLNKKDIPGTLLAASALADSYKGRDNIGMLRLACELSNISELSSANETFSMIIKEAIEAAVEILENVENEELGAETIMLLGRALTYLPYYHEDPDFLLSMSQRIAKLYEDCTNAQCRILTSGILDEIKMTYRNLLAHLDSWTIHGFDNLSKCMGLLFNSKTPRRDMGRETFMPSGIQRLEEKLALNREHSLMVRNLHDFSAEIGSLSEQQIKERLPELESRYRAIESYFATSPPQLVGPGGEAHRLSLHVDALLLWCHVDAAHLRRAVRPHAEKLFSIKEPHKLPAIAALKLSQTFMSLSGAFAGAGYMGGAFFSLVHFLRHDNFYYRNTCFEYGPEYFAERVEFGHPYYRQTVSMAVPLIYEYGFCPEELYVEICKRKNILYLAEGWRRGYGKISDMHGFLGRNVSFSDIQAAMPEDAVLIDFVFCSLFPGGTGPKR